MPVLAYRQTVFIYKLLFGLLKMNEYWNCAYGDGGGGG